MIDPAAGPADLPFRQIHLDFHTSEHIEGVGRDFDPDRFADTLAEAGVNSVTCFARCHHGYLYYPSSQNPERIHPQLERPNLLIEQIEACHQRGIRVPIYTTVQWDAFTADQHRDWLCIDEQGKEFGSTPLEPGFYRFLDVLHSGYRQFLFDHVRELFQMMPVDGLFFDIVQPRASLARHWLDAMDAAGVDPADAAARQRFAIDAIARWKGEMTAFIRSLGEDHANALDCTIFYNAGHVGPRHRSSIDAYTHLELESLPSGGWGYLHFPMTQRYARGLGGKPTMGMTGKFHTSWGDFHSYKNPAALDYECFMMLALGARCSIGDQLHPNGELDDATYDLIGRTYHQVEAVEPWCRGVEPVVEVGVLTPEEFVGLKGEHLATAERQNETTMGLTRMLQELKVQFDLVSSDRELGGYRLIIVPDGIPATPTVIEKLKQYLAEGGRVLVTGDSLINCEDGAFALDELDVKLIGPPTFTPDFLVPSPGFVDDLPQRPHVMYRPGMHTEAAPGAAVLAEVQRPYFNRTWRHYCSHRHAPSNFESIGPGIVQSAAGNAIYFAHPVFAQYQANAPRWCKQLIDAAIDRLMPGQLVQTDGPSSLIAAVNDQPAEKRYVLHLLNYIPERRGSAFDVIEDVIPLHEVTVSLRLPKPIKSARLVPEDRELELGQDGDAFVVRLAELRGCQIVELTR